MMISMKLMLGYHASPILNGIKKYVQEQAGRLLRAVGKTIMMRCDLNDSMSITWGGSGRRRGEGGEEGEGAPNQGPPRLPIHARRHCCSGAYPTISQLLPSQSFPQMSP